MKNTITNSIPGASFCAILLLVPACSSGSESTSDGGVASVDQGKSYSTIQAAIDAAPDGGVVRIGAGTFAEELHIEKRLTLRGEGTLTRIRSSGQRRSDSDDSSDNTRAGLTIRNVDGLVIEDMDFSNNPEDGVVIRNSSNIELRGVIAIGNGDDGVDVRSSTGVRITSSASRASEFSQNGDRGVQIRGSEGVMVELAAVTANAGDGVRIRESQKSTITENTISGNLESGIRVRDSSGIELRGNTIANNREYGIRLRDSTDTALADNTFGTGNARGNIRRE